MLCYDWQLHTAVWNSSSSSTTKSKHSISTNTSTAGSNMADVCASAGAHLKLKQEALISIYRVLQ